MTDMDNSSALARFFQTDNSAIEAYDDQQPTQFEGYLPEDRIIIPARISQTVLGQTYSGFGGLSKSDLEMLTDGAKRALGVSVDSKGKITTAARGHIFVGHKDKTSGEATLWKFANLDMIPIVNLTSWYKDPETGRSSLVGGRTYWPVDPATGQRDQDPNIRPTCRSNDGYNPVAFYVGTDANRDHINTGWEPRLGKEVAFGFDENGTQLKAGTICIKCPFAQFLTVNGKVQGPSCKETYNYIVFLPGQMDLDGNWMEARLAVLAGNNTSIGQALKGRAPKQSFGHADETKALVGIAKFKDFVKKSEKFVALQNVTDSLLGSIIAISGSDSAADKGRKKNIQAINRGSVLCMEDLEEIVAMVESRFHPNYVVVEIEEYMWAPQGLPHIVGEDAPVYPLSMSVAENNSSPAQRIPYIQAGPGMNQFYNEPMDAEAYYTFQELGKQANEYRRKWREQIPANQQQVVDKLAVLSGTYYEIGIEQSEENRAFLADNNSSPVDD